MPKKPPASPSPLSAGADAWENEGGTPRQAAATSLPDGITAVAATHYSVGPYRYTNLDDALAELGRQTAR